MTSVSTQPADGSKDGSEVTLLSGPASPALAAWVVVLPAAAPAALAQEVAALATEAAPLPGHESSGYSDESDDSGDSSDGSSSISISL